MKVLAIILAGGKGSRLYPLTEDRCKPAVVFGGKYRIIDFTLSNCINSGIRNINVMVQYLSDSLQKHIRNAWSILSPALNEYVDVYPPQQIYEGSWYRGTADAIFQNLYTIERMNLDYILILSGDHIYEMDYRNIIQYHIDKNSDLTIATVPVKCAEAKGFGIININEQNKVIGFEEKPKNPKHIPGNKFMALASMGIYVFSKEVLLYNLKLDARSSSSHDFGKDIIPNMVLDNNVYSFAHQDPKTGNPLYWKDVGTIKSLYDANMDFLKPKAPISLYNEDWKYRTYQENSTPTMLDNKNNNISFYNNIITGGSIIKGSVMNSILSPGVIVEEDALVEDSILFGHCVISKGAYIKKSIIEKNVVIPKDTYIGYDVEKDRHFATIAEDNIRVIPKSFKPEDII